MYASPPRGLVRRSPGATRLRDDVAGRLTLSAPLEAAARPSSKPIGCCAGCCRGLDRLAPPRHRGRRARCGIRSAPAGWPRGICRQKSITRRAWNVVLNPITGPHVARHRLAQGPRQGHRGAFSRAAGQRGHSTGSRRARGEAAAAELGAAVRARRILWRGGGRGAELRADGRRGVRSASAARVLLRERRHLPRPAASGQTEADIERICAQRQGQPCSRSRRACTRSRSAAAAAAS